MLETRYLPTIGESNLKEVDGYKIRLITVEELTSNLECVSESYGYYCTSSQYASWVYQNFEDGSNTVYSYWTMTPHTNPNSAYVWSVISSGEVDFGFVHSSYYGGFGVRPVINLLKSSIE